MDLTGARVLLTGASSGIGAALALRLAEAGAVLGLTGRDAARLEAVLTQCQERSPDSQATTADLADPAATDAVASWALEALGAVDLLINNAGIPKRRHVSRLSPDEVDLVTQVNYLAPVHLTLALLPGMLERGSGRIVNVSSVGALLSSPAEAAYSASKSALSVFSETMAIDLWDSGVKVQLVYPGVVDTPLFEVPDEDELMNPVEPIPVDEAIDQIMAIFENDALITYVPPMFEELATGKATNLAVFLEGAAEFARELRGPESVGGSPNA